MKWEEHYGTEGVQELISREKKDRHDFEEIAALASKMGLYSHSYMKVIVFSKVPLPNYRFDLDEKRPQREVEIDAGLQRRVHTFLNDHISSKSIRKDAFQGTAFSRSSSNGSIAIDEGLLELPESPSLSGSITDRITSRRNMLLRDQQLTWKDSHEGRVTEEFRRSLPALILKSGMYCSLKSPTIRSQLYPYLAHKKREAMEEISNTSLHTVRIVRIKMRLKSFRVKNGTTTVRSWDEMNYDVLLKMLNNMPPDSCSTFFHGKTFLQDDKYRYIAERNPSLQQLIIPREVGIQFVFILPAMLYWMKLKKVQCHSILIALSRDIETLRLFGPVDDEIAAIIRDKCPRLKRSSLDHCVLSPNALSTILDNHQELKVLDTGHSFLVPDFRRALNTRSPSLKWNDEEIQRKAARVELHLKCD